ncbi:MAG: ribosomal protein S18-alanine N-acetyltransferase [Chloroflexi bacterium]|nr:ribosomal protein S18-alanine N-acetyltransferase [Chloroflexota bacterium]
MKFAIRPMKSADIPQVAEIDRQAFPTMWPPTSFTRELSNKLARYFVAYEDVDPALSQAAEKEAESRTGGDKRGVAGWLRGLFSTKAGAVTVTNQHVLGFAGMWCMFDEVHLTTIAVRRACWRRGIGEALLITVIEYAAEHGAETVTLEVRASNFEAQALYEKYGFKPVGVRRGYYTDNREDALIMTTDRITSAAYQSQFQRLKAAYARRQVSVQLDVP